MLITIKIKNTDNIIGLKEDISARLEGVAEIERIDVQEGKTIQSGKDFYSPDEVRKMTQNQVRENYQAIINSMKKWN